VVESQYDTWHLLDKLCGATWPSHGLPHHMAPLCWLFVQNIMESVGIEPQTSPKVQCFGSVWATTSPHGGPYIAYLFYYI
jgi:hypothetical protein